MQAVGLKEYLKVNEGAYQSFHRLNNAGQLRVSGFHKAKWIQKNGVILRDDFIPNLITTVGKNLILTSGVGTQYINLIVENRHVNDIQSFGNTTINSAAASWVGGDVGRQLTIVGAGAAGANWVGTIATVVNSTVATISSNTTTTATGQTGSVGPLFVAGDTAASHAGWVEIANSNITNGTRAAWNYTITTNSAAGPTNPTSITLASAIPTQYIHGFLVSQNATLWSTANTLLAEAEYGSTNPGVAIVGAGAQLQDTYTVTLN